jgi:hypothetical protein
MKQYLYVYEHGEIKQTSMEPTEGDLELVRDGVLSIIFNGSDDSYYELDGSGEYDLIEETELEDGYQI